jgi:hypothetical protein
VNLFPKVNTEFIKSKHIQHNTELIDHKIIDSEMSSIKRAYFETPDGQLHYRFLLTTHSPKKAPCIFLHMSADGSRYFETIMKLHAARGHDCYAPDMPRFVLLP